MVGLPARGKTYISRKIVRYLNWLGYQARVFNIGNYRREICGTTDCKADFFDPKNNDAAKQREQCAILAFEDLVKFLKNGGDIAIYDGTNSTKERRMYVKNAI